MSNTKERLAQLTPDKRALLLKKLHSQKRTQNTNGATDSSTAPSTPHPVPRDQPLPLSFAQERLWILQQLQGPSITYNAPIAWRLTGPFNQAAFERAVQELVQRHESLRTTIGSSSGARSGIGENQPVQVIHGPEVVPLARVDLQATPAAERAAKLNSLLQQAVARPFDLQQECPIRMTLYTLGEEDHLFLVSMHHIVIDGWSLNLFTQELSQLYAAFVRGEPSPLLPLPIQYADYAVWQRKWLQGDLLAEKLAFWQTHLTVPAGSPPPPLELPTDFPRPAVQSFEGAIYRFALPAARLRQLQQLSQQAGATLFMTLYSAFAVLLARYSNQHDQIIGTTIANRTRPESKSLIGFFINMLPLRTDLSANQSFSALLEQVRQTTLDAYQHQDLPFEKMVEAVRPERSLSHEPLIQVVFDLQSASFQELTLTDLTVSTMPLGLHVSHYDLALSMLETPDGLRGNVEYSTALFTAATIERMMGHFCVLLEAICADPNRPVLQLPLLPPKEEREILVEWNDSQVAYSQDQCVHHLVEKQAAQKPDATAVVFAGQTLCYGELNRQANQLAHHLRVLGVTTETVVGICLERSVALVVSVLAVLKAGGAYLPMDPNYPPDRLRFMLSDAQAAVLLTQHKLAAHFDDDETVRICVDEAWSEIAHAPTTNPTALVTADNLAYTIYTSGSTGRPKGVMLTHGGLLNLIHWHQRAFAITANDHATSLAGLGFDASVWELWPYLTAGAALHLIQGETLGSATQIRDWLVAEQITVTFLPTPLAEQVLPLAWPSHSALRIMLTGGDRLRGYPPADLPFQLVNNYGPTENTVVATSGVVENKGRPTPSIGRPIDNVQVYILDGYGQPTPIGVPGELHIGGNSLARGYLHHLELTNEKFVPNPFGAGQLYKTGDLVRYLPALADGPPEIEFLGRIDNQVKLRGFRIELGEIEAVLRQQPTVQEATVLITNDGGIQQLVAYVVPQGASPDVAQLRLSLAASLPEYMVPAHFVYLETLPLTPNGKVDQAALRRLSRADNDGKSAFVPPRTHTEQEMEAIWSKLLKQEQVSVTANFFDLGGHSLLAMQTVSMIYAQFGVELTQYAVFEQPTIAALAAHIDRLQLMQRIMAGSEQTDAAVEIVEWA